jgi:predicted DNA binding CopG/RHH family protein
MGKRHEIPRPFDYKNTSREGIRKIESDALAMREKLVSIRLTDGEHQRIKSQADKIGLELAAYLRMLALKAAYNEGPIKED